MQNPHRRVLISAGSMHGHGLLCLKYYNFDILFITEIACDRAIPYMRAYVSHWTFAEGLMLYIKFFSLTFVCHLDYAPFGCRFDKRNASEMIHGESHPHRSGEFSRPASRLHPETDTKLQSSTCADARNQSLVAGYRRGVVGPSS